MAERSPTSEIPARRLVRMGITHQWSGQAVFYAESVRPRSSHRDLDAEVVSGLIAAQFPELTRGEVLRLGSGWDHEVFSVGTEWIFRFPKRPGRVAWLTREIKIVDVVSEVLGSMVPRFERIGEPSDAYPYPFVGYRRVPGVGCDRAGPDDRAGLAEDIGHMLNALHCVAPDRIPPTPAGWEHETWSELRTELVAVGVHVRSLLGAELLVAAEPYLAGRVPEPPQGRSRRFIHNDLCPDHLLVDSDTGRLTGLIDFTDAMVGDPVLDFVGLIGIGGYRFIHSVTAAYDLPLEEDFGTKLEWLTRVLTLTWLAEAAVHDPGDISKHQSWVSRAFGH